MLKFWKKNPQFKSVVEKFLGISIGAAIITAILVNLEFNFLEASLYDFRMTRSIQAPADPGIVLISLDDQTTRALNDFAPLAIDQHTRLLEALNRQNPKAVGYLVNMNYVHQVDPALFQGNGGTRFVELATALENRGIPFLIGTPFDVNGEVLPPFPLSSLRHSIAVVHKDGNVFSEDKVTRRALLTLYGKSAFHLQLARDAQLDTTETLPRGSFYVREAEGDYFFFRYHGNPNVTFGAGGVADRPHSLPYTRYSFVDVIEGRIPPKALEGKVVLVGTLVKENPGDFARTPYSKISSVSPNLAVHANIIDSIAHDDGLVMAPAWLNWLTTFLAVGFILWSILGFTPMQGVLATLGLAASLMLIAHVLFHGLSGNRGLWLNLSQPLIGIFLGYYLAVPYRLIREYKKRWDYQRKNEILTQVEELKTNFLQLVTHDLKTPVARIQGLSEVLLSKAAANLEPKDRETLNSIIVSTDELNHFITTILELTKVESNELNVSLQSKDVNQLLEGVIQRFRAAARAKEIDIVASLEPLFPIKLDPTLISKVFSNLIDNAVKYSPPGSKVEISSQERDGHIEVQVKDHGIGLSREELENLFTKFYRAKNDTTTKIAGTGLGLYLTKYFVESHAGEVRVESQEGQGSTFIIRLPIDLKAVTFSGNARPGLTNKKSGKNSGKPAHVEEGVENV
ncbi:MAG: ATP-binding protein [Bacteriovoracia bacterium]